MIYAGIGARETPLDVQYQMCNLAVLLGLSGHTLRSGGAKGADMAFHAGAQSIGGKAEIIPARAAEGQTGWAEFAAQYHPAWDSLPTPYARWLMARNTAIMFGRDCQRPVDFVLCWTPGARIVGGTGQALRIAAAYHIPVFNLALPGQDLALWQFVR